MNWIETSDEDDPPASTFGTTFESKKPSPWYGEDETTLMPPSTPQKLNLDDVEELLSHVIVGCKKTLVLKHFKVVLPRENGRNQKLSPPQYEYPPGIYIIVSPMKYRGDGEKTRCKDRDMTWEDYYTLLPAHLQDHVWRDLPDGECTWSLSGPQFNIKSKPTVQQRYCYPRGRGEFANTKGASLWTAYDQDHQEIYTYRVLHVYFSTKRANGKTDPSPVKPPAPTAESPTDATDLAMAELYANVNQLDDFVLDWDIDSQSRADEEEDLNVPDGFTWDQYLQPLHDSPPQSGYGFCNDLADAATTAASAIPDANSLEPMDSVDMFERKMMDYVNQYDGPYVSDGRVVSPPSGIVAAHPPVSPPPGFHVFWDPRCLNSPVMSIEADHVLPARVSLGSHAGLHSRAQVSARSVTWAPLPDIFEDPDIH